MRLARRAVILVAVLAATASASLVAVVAAHNANPPYMGMPPGPEHHASGTVWAVTAYVVWAAPAGLAIWWWRRWGLLIAIGVALVAHWYVPAVAYATRSSA